MYKKILLVIMFVGNLYSQAPLFPGSVQEWHLAQGLKDTLSATFVAADTTELKAIQTNLDGSLAKLNKYSSGNVTGSGLFIQLTSTHTTDKYNVFESAISGKRWIRITKPDVPDTNVLKNLPSIYPDGYKVTVKQFSSSNVDGIGDFVQEDSAFTEGIVQFDHTTTGKGWVRQKFLEDSLVSLDWVVNGDFSGAQADTGSRDDATAIQAALDVGAGIILKQNGKYLLRSGLDVANKKIIANGATIYTVAQTGEAIAAAGALGTTASDTSFLADTAGIKATRYLNRLTDIGNKVVVYDGSKFSAGDMIIIKSDSTRGGIKIGESALIMNVTEDTLWLETSLHGYYLPDNNALVTRVNYATLDISGNLRIIYIGREQDELGTKTGKGLALSYLKNPVIDKIITENIIAYSVYVSSCYRPEIEFSTSNSRVTGLGYGLAISDATTNGLFHGKVAGARHCVTTGAGTNQGIPWGNIISGDFWGAPYSVGDTWLMDTHGSTGSTIFKNCVLRYRGVATTEGLVTNSYGFNLGGAQNYIFDTELYGIYRGIQSRADYDTLVVRNCYAEEMIGNFMTFREHEIKYMSFENVSTTGDFATITSSNGTIGKWFFNNIRTGGRFMTLTNTSYTLPNKLIATNINCDNDRVQDLSIIYPASSDEPAFDIQSISQIDTLIVSDFRVRGYEAALYLGGAHIDFVSVSSFIFDNVLQPIALSSADINTINISNGVVGRMTTRSDHRSSLLHFIAAGDSSVHHAVISGVQLFSGKFFAGCGLATGLDTLTLSNVYRGPEWTSNLSGLANAWVDEDVDYNLLKVDYYPTTGDSIRLIIRNPTDATKDTTQWLEVH